MRHQASLYYLPLLIILHAASYMVFIPGETRKQDDDDKRSVAKDKGPKESRGGLSLIRYGRESSAETVFGVFLPRSLVKLEYVPFLDQNSQ